MWNSARFAIIISTFCDESENKFLIKRFNCKVRMAQIRYWMYFNKFEAFVDLQCELHKLWYIQHRFAIFFEMSYWLIYTWMNITNIISFWYKHTKSHILNLHWLLAIIMIFFQLNKTFVTIMYNVCYCYIVKSISILMKWKH